MAGLQTNTNQVTHPEESSESKSTNEDPLVKDTTTTTTLNDTPETNDDVDDDVMEEELQDHDDDDKVNVSPQETQQDSPLSYPPPTRLPQLFLVPCRNLSWILLRLLKARMHHRLAVCSDGNRGTCYC